MTDTNSNPNPRHRKLVRVASQETKRKRWNPEDHKKWLKKVWGNRQVSLADKYLRADREDNKL